MHGLCVCVGMLAIGLPVSKLTQPLAAAACMSTYASVKAEHMHESGQHTAYLYPVAACLAKRFTCNSSMQNST